MSVHRVALVPYSLLLVVLAGCGPRATPASETQDDPDHRFAALAISREAASFRHYDALFLPGLYTDEVTERYEGTANEAVVLAHVNDPARDPADLGGDHTLEPEVIEILRGLRAAGGVRSVRQLGVALEPEVVDFKILIGNALGIHPNDV